MTYREMRELSYAGFAVFHDEAIIPVIEANIPLMLKYQRSTSSRYHDHA